MEISIHALVKRATIAYRVVLIPEVYFNPRPRKEGDLFNAHCLQHSSYFNPRPRKEGDQGCLRGYYSASHFNPRPRKEGDLQSLIKRLMITAISIHALVKRATEPLHNVSESYMYFNPRPRKEGDRELLLSLTLKAVFQSTPS